jgi:hypothetical protein
MIPKYPVYVITYKRWDSRITERALEEMKVPYYLIVDKPDIEKYKAKASSYCTILELPESYRNNYDTFWEKEGPLCSGPARNFVWDHSVENGDERHWILDDNINGFARLWKNTKYKCISSSVMNAMEDFTDRFENIGLAGPQYRFFANESSKLKPYSLNSKNYSCILIKNDMPFRWRGRYNEDIDLGLRVLKGGYCTIQFNAFLQNKAGTQSVKGGNNEAIYQDEGTYLKSKMIKEMHPDEVELTYLFGRPHHQIDYSSFRWNKLKPKKELNIKKRINEYGMRLISVEK